MELLLPPPQSFSCFSGLPVEIRLRIWRFAAPRRPRVIQVAFDPNGSCWKAWEDGLGGLPSIVHVSQEAREEALKPYTRILDTYVDPEEDTIFISDPIFSIRKPRNIFMSSEYANTLRKVAFTSEIYDGLAQAFSQFPSLCEAPATILRKLKGLTHFTLAVSEDGAGFEYSSDRGEEDEDEEDGDEEDGENEEGDTSRPDEEGYNSALDHDEESNTIQDDGYNEPDKEGESEDSPNDEATVRQFLDRLDEDAVQIMSKGYFRHLGNIHFESAAGHPDHWEDWEIYRQELEVSCEQEKEGFPGWVRPKISVMAVEYGLNRLGDFRTKLHLLGDHSDDALETTEDGYASEAEDGNEIESDVNL